MPPSCQGQGLPAEQKCECENWTQYNGHPEITVCWTNDKINRYNNVAYNCMFKKNLILYNDLLFRNGQEFVDMQHKKNEDQNLFP